MKGFAARWRGLILLGLMLAISLAAYSQDKPLAVDQAFQVKLQVQDPQHVTLVWTIAPNYHLYSDAFGIKVLTPPAAAVADWQLPDGQPGYDNIRGHYLAYYGQLVLPLTLTQGDAHHLRLQVSYQGCADLGFCYPPQTKVLTTDSGGWASWWHASGDVHQIETLLGHQSLAGVWLSFFVFGLLLAFTPCVFPMLPILSSIIVGQGPHLSTWRAFCLSAVYVGASALTYAVAGVLAGLAGHHLQSSLQNPWVMGVFGLILVLLSLSLFGFYELQLPHGWQQRLDQVNRKQSRGTLWGVAIMGCVSTLVVSPCVSAPLIGALTYIGQQGNPWLGGSALLVMGLGMGLPLLLVGVSAGKYLPTAGQWMVRVKAAFGVALLVLAIYLWSRFLTPTITLVLWGLLAIGLAVYLGAFEAAITAWARFNKAAGLALALYGACLIIGAASGADNPWQPLAKFMPVNQAQAGTFSSSLWQPLNTVAQWQQIEAQRPTTPVLVDFYADWCESCVSMDQHVFANAVVQQQLKAKQVRLLRVNVTQQTPEQLALQQHFHVVAPPTMILVEGDRQQQIVGEQSVEDFVAKMQSW